MKNLLKTKKLLKKLNNKLPLLLNHGFKLTNKDSSCRGVYKNKKLGVVVKRPYIVGWEPSKKVKVPTIKIGREPRYVDSCCLGCCSQIFIQPIVGRRNLDLAVEKLSEFESESTNNSCGGDFYRRNVGWYNGKPVVFDW